MGELMLVDADVMNVSGAGLVATNLEVGRDLNLAGSFAGSAEDTATLALAGCKVGGQIRMASNVHQNRRGDLLPVSPFGRRVFRGKQWALASVTNDRGAGLDMTAAFVQGDLHLGGNITGAGVDGAVNLARTRISGRLRTMGLRLSNQSGPGIRADRLSAESGIFLQDDGGHGDGSTTFIEANGNATVDLAASSMMELMVEPGVVLRNSEGLLLDLEGSRVSRDLAVYATGLAGLIAVERVSVGGNVLLPSEDTPKTVWLVDQLTYSGIPGPYGVTGVRELTDGWLNVLRNRTLEYGAQPYQQLSHAVSLSGHEAEVRRVLIAQREDQIRRALPRKRDRAWARFTGLMLGYGYQPWRALIALFCVVAVAVVFAFTLGRLGALEQHSTSSVTVVVGGTPQAVTKQTTTRCSAGQIASYAISVSLPAIETATVGGQCELARDGTGTVLIVGSWLCQIAAFALATLFIAGFTGIVRKS
jgi:hypothetical protein